MTSRTNADDQYKGLDRRSSTNRRDHFDRRNLVRFESLGSDRRDGGDDESRREEDLFIELYP